MPDMMTSVAARTSLLLLLVLAPAAPAGAQSLFLERGQHAVEGVAGWSFGPSSDGLETRIGVSFGGQIDVGIGQNRYTLDFDDGSSSSFRETAPYFRWFVVKEGNAAPVSLALGAQYFVSHIDGPDSGAYVMLGPTVYKRFNLSEATALYPFLGFSFVGESYTFSGETDRAAYLARSLGLIFTTRLTSDGRSLMRFEVEEQSFRSETYRAARVGYVQRF
jgi:hypothetical protein